MGGITFSLLVTGKAVEGNVPGRAWDRIQSAYRLISALAKVHPHFSGQSTTFKGLQQEIYNRFSQKKPPPPALPHGFFFRLREHGKGKLYKLAGPPAGLAKSSSDHNS